MLSRPVLVSHRCGARVARRARAGTSRCSEGSPSGRTSAGDGALFFGDERVRGGRRRRRLQGVEMLPCVSQGAAPLGREVTITAAEGNIIHELAGRPALQTVQQIISELSPRERGLVAGGLLIGVVIDGGKPEYEQGDFLVRGVLGADTGRARSSSARSVAPGQVVRLHARDARSADEDLRQALKLRVEALAGERAGRRARVLVQRPRHRDVRHRRPRRRGDRARARRRAVGGVLCRRRDRPGRRPQLPARLHRDAGGVPAGFMSRLSGNVAALTGASGRARPRDRAGGGAAERRPLADRPPDRGARAARRRPRGSCDRLRPLASRGRRCG